MTKKLVLFFAAVSLLLSGCQLARPEEQIADSLPVTEDQIVGILISMDTMTPGISDGLHLFSKEGERIYAELTEETYETSDGSMGTTHRFVFPEGSGFTFFGYRVAAEMVPETDQDTDYWSSTIDDGIVMEKNSYNTVNEDSFVQLEAVIYVADTATDLVLYPNPIYQTDSGKVYALGTSPSGLHAVSMYDCSVAYSQNETTKTNGQNTDESGGYVKMTVKVIHLADSYRIIQMDNNHNVIQSQDYVPEEMPAEYIPDSNCGYIILEEYSEGNNVIRTVKSPDDNNQMLESFYPLESGICHKGHTQIKWEGVR